MKHGVACDTDCWCWNRRYPCQCYLWDTDCPNYDEENWVFSFLPNQYFHLQTNIVINAEDMPKELMT